MTQYEKALILWRKKKISTDAELAEALNGHSIAFAYNSGKIENDKITYYDTTIIPHSRRGTGNRSWNLFVLS